ncbi:MAG: hypothetical protein ACOCP8_00160 [archaeon]
MLRFGILGIGQCGTSIAEYAFKQGFKAVIANTAKVDLDQAKYIPDDCKIHLGGQGAGREREIGAERMIDSAEYILKKCKQQFEGCDAVFVTASGGGGTGSGALPVGLEILMSFNKYVGSIIVLPEEKESPKAKMNALDCFGEISELENLGSVFIIDNAKAKQLNPYNSRRQIYEITNSEVIDLIVELNALTDKPSYVSNFDAGDLLGVIRERGYTLLSKTEYYSYGKEDKYDIASKIRESWKSNYQPYFNDGQILKGAIIGKINERLSSRVDVHLIFQETGIPYDFNDVYFYPETPDIENDLGTKNKNTFYTILSGLAFPNSRLGNLNQDVKKMEDRLMKNFNLSQTQKFENENWGNKFSKKVVNLDFNRNNSDAGHEKINLMEKLSKYKK